MSANLLIDEPPLLVLPSLVCQVGLPAAILLQQIHFAGRREPDGWVERTVGDWTRALKGCLSDRTIERALKVLRDHGWVEYEVRPGTASRYRVGPDKLSGPSANSAGEGPPIRRGGLYREEKIEGKERTTSSQKPVKLEDEVDGFSEWLEAHVDYAARFDVMVSVPKPETAARTELHKRFAALVAEGRSVRDLKAASLGVLSSKWHRDEKHTKFITVLRQPEKLDERIDAGLAFVAAQESGTAPDAKYGHLNG